MKHQVPVLLSDARNKLAVAGRRWGKSIMALVAVVEGHGSTPGRLKGALQGGNIWWVAPTYGVSGIIWRHLKRAMWGAWEEKNEKERFIILPNGGMVTVKSADNPDGLRGDGLDGVVLDESAIHTPDVWREAVRPALSDMQGWSLHISTPRGKKNHLYELFTKAERIKSWERWQRPTWDNPIIPPEEIADAREDLGDVAFRQEYGAEFVDYGADLFRRSWFRYWKFNEHDQGLIDLHGVDGITTVALARCRKFATVDLAASLRTSADFTVIATWAVTPHKDLILLDQHRGRFEGPDHPRMIRNAYERWNPAYIAVEKTGFQLALVQQLVRTGLPIRALVPDRDKISRALPAAARMESGSVFFPAAASWLPDLEDEILSFPHGTHDDQVDVLSYAVLEVATGKVPITNLDLASPATMRVNPWRIP